jgi:translation initiation factor IF-2
MTIRLNKVTRDLNVGITTVVEFLQKKGHVIEASPNTKITEEQYAILVKEFSKDKNLKMESEKFIQERQNKERNKASISIEGYEEPKKEEIIKAVIPEEVRPKFKQVGKIDLDNLNKKRIDSNDEKPEEVQAPEEVATEQVVVVEEVKQEPVIEMKPEPALVVETKEDMEEVVVSSEVISEPMQEKELRNSVSNGFRNVRQKDNRSVRWLVPVPASSHPRWNM